VFKLEYKAQNTQNSFVGRGFAQDPAKGSFKAISRPPICISEGEAEGEAVGKEKEEEETGREGREGTGDGKRRDPIKLECKSTRLPFAASLKFPSYPPLPFSFLPLHIHPFPPLSSAKGFGDITPEKYLEFNMRVGAS